MRQIAIYLQNAREEDSAKIVREFHENIGQYIIIMKMDLQEMLF